MTFVDRLNLHNQVHLWASPSSAVALIGVSLVSQTKDIIRRTNLQFLGLKTWMAASFSRRRTMHQYHTTAPVLVSRSAERLTANDPFCSAASACLCVSFCIQPTPDKNLNLPVYIIIERVHWFRTLAHL